MGTRQRPQEGSATPQGRRCPDTAGLSLGLHMGSLSEVHVIRIWVVTDGPQKGIFRLKNVVVSRTGMPLKSDLYEMLHVSMIYLYGL